MIRRSAGASLVEYVLIIAGVSALSIISLETFGVGLSESIDHAGRRIRIETKQVLALQDQGGGSSSSMQEDDAATDVVTLLDLN